MNRIGIWVSSLLLLLALASSMLFVVDQRQFGVVYALGQIKEVITEPGLNIKLPPPLQNVTYIDKRLLTLDSPDTEPMLTAEKQRVVIDWYVRWRITDPMAYIRNVGLDEKAGANQLNRVVRNAFQEEINKRTVKDLLSLSRDILMNDVKREVLDKVRGEKLGVWTLSMFASQEQTMSTPLPNRFIDAWRQSVSVLPTNFALRVVQRERKSVLMPIDSARSPLPMLTAMLKKSKARAIHRLPKSTTSPLAAILNLRSFTEVSMPTRPVLLKRAMSWF